MHVRLEMFQLLVDSKNEWKWILFLFQCEENHPNCHRDSSCDVCVPPSVYGQQWLTNIREVTWFEHDFQVPFKFTASNDIFKLWPCRCLKWVIAVEPRCLYHPWHCQLFHLHVFTGSKEFGPWDSSKSHEMAAFSGDNVGHLLCMIRSRSCHRATSGC